ncbi:sulfate reduction electron transfer complex DsrMKJOP subunit DsrO [Halorhodospira halophila]|uniref:4Fe-4S ferredoxin, iron-sulfur binding domain protein n=1 Tax=Halorhodospira halophila (strain DSM 244 / SL1) TaxID=349124 RepID=A1WYG3_HALHL|nr:4Fe-4S dicluster domain-containing protein [Halorhodospira halophila]ABM62725.1 4Fe-4S ferredoxin, iron-sulfur binding domain protein [Halorhodospira halophila SL1]MBK1728406.1 4Fe-4S ferredoxin [Halorhodospira halophila]
MSDKDPVGISRRRLLGGAAALAGAALAPGLFLVQARPDGGADAGVRWGLLVDTTRCAEDCQACVDACREENGWPAGDGSAGDIHWIRKVDLEPVREDGPGHSAPVMCQHCAEPPCVSVCPTRASFRRADGIVLVDKHRCIGCRYCMVACPFHARAFVDEPVAERSPNHPRGKGTVEACTLCVHRIDRGEAPACVARCAETGHAALIFGDLNDPDSEIRQALRKHRAEPLRPDLALDAGVRYHGLS